MPSKVLSEIFLTDAGIIISVILVLKLKAPIFISVTELGILIASSPVFENP